MRKMNRGTLSSYLALLSGRGFAVNDYLSALVVELRRSSLIFVRLPGLVPSKRGRELR